MIELPVEDHDRNESWSRFSRATRGLCAGGDPAAGGGRGRPAWCSMRLAAARATCGKCRVVVAERLRPSPRAAERELFSADELHAGCRLACQTPVEGPDERPGAAASLVDRRHQILVHSRRRRRRRGRSGRVASAMSSCPRPTRGDDAPDLVRLKRPSARSRPIWSCSANCPPAARDRFPRHGRAGRRPPLRLRAGKHRVGLLRRGRRLGHHHARCRAVGSGHRPAGPRRFAAQSADPLRRRRADANPPGPHQPDGLGNSNAAVAEALDEMIGELCRRRASPRQQVYEVTLAGNTTMQQLFCGIDPAPLGEVPFVPAVRRGLPVPAAEARPADPSPRPGLRPADHRRLRGRRHRGRHSGHRAGRLPGSRRC